MFFALKVMSRPSSRPKFPSTAIDFCQNLETSQRAVIVHPVQVQRDWKISKQDLLCLFSNHESSHGLCHNVAATYSGFIKQRVWRA